MKNVLIGLTILLLTGCTSNRCQTLCDRLYRMQLACDLFAQDNYPTRAQCGENNDPQTAQEKADYALRRCRSDFLEASCTEERGCCKAACFESLLTTYETLDGSAEEVYENQRALCRKYHDLVRQGDAPWCDPLRKACEQGLEADRPECVNGG